MPTAVWLPLLFAGIGAFFLALDLSMGVTRLVFSGIHRNRQPGLFWLAETGNVLLLTGGLSFAAYDAWFVYVAPIIG